MWVARWNSDSRSGRAAETGVRLCRDTSSVVIACPSHPRVARWTIHRSKFFIGKVTLPAKHNTRLTKFIPMIVRHPYAVPVVLVEAGGRQWNSVCDNVAAEFQIPDTSRPPSSRGILEQNHLLRTAAAAAVNQKYTRAPELQWLLLR
jgi:hypothetical protein